MLQMSTKVNNNKKKSSQNTSENLHTIVLVAFAFSSSSKEPDKNEMSSCYGLFRLAYATTTLFRICVSGLLLLNMNIFLIRK